MIATLQACERGQNKEKTAISFDSKNLTDITRFAKWKNMGTQLSEKLGKAIKTRQKQRKTAVFCSNAKVLTALGHFSHLVQS